MAAHVFHQLYYHCIWATAGRHPLIIDQVRECLIDQITSASRKRGAGVLACNAMPDHVHLFVTLPPTATLSAFIGQVKGAAAHDFNAHYENEHFLAWQEGYGVVTVRKGEAQKVIDYVVNQQSIHADRKGSRLLEQTEETAP